MNVGGRPLATLVTEDGRECTRCRVFKPWDEFTNQRHGHRGKMSSCKRCRSGVEGARIRDLRATSEDFRMRRATQKLRERHGLTAEQYDEMLEAQGGGCAICGSPDSRTKRQGLRPLAVDHDHTTGAVRGLLCDPCNNGISRFGDDVQLLAKAIEYLEGQA